MGDLKIGLIVNPIAGIGGRVGLKVSDGKEIVQEAFRRGAIPSSLYRARTMLEMLGPSVGAVMTYPGVMGANAAEVLPFQPSVIGRISDGDTTGKDTTQAAQDLALAGVDIIVFVGGDGTARDVLDGSVDLPCIGVPAGVKMHSSVFAVSPRRAAEAVDSFAMDPERVRQMEVMDIDEDAVRKGRMSPRLYGYLSVPDAPRLIQNAKASSSSQTNLLSGICSRVAEIMEDGRRYVLGPGTTTSAIGAHLGVETTLVGIDVVQQGRIIVLDASEAELLKVVDGHSSAVIVSLIGGQGFVLGRGNPQISPAVIDKVGEENVIVVATREKLMAITGSLRVDTGSIRCDQALSGYRRVITGMGEDSVWKVES